MPINDSNLAVTYDTHNNVLYVCLTDQIIKSSKTPEDDNFVILNYNANGEIVGLQLLEFSDATETYWRSFEKEIPPILFNAVLNWIGSD
jgi:uncharacterized protein YuzE